GRAAAPHAVEVVHHRQALGGALVARVEDEAVRVDDGGGPDVAPVRPEHGAGRGAGGAQDALRRGVEELAVLGALEPFGGGRRLLVDEVRQHRLVGVEERLHVDDQVLEDREAGERLYGDPRAQVLHQHLAGQAVAAVDQHRVRAADAVGARAPERPAAGTIPLDVVEDVEDPLVRDDAQLVLLPAALLCHLASEPQMPWAHERRNARLPVRSHLMSLRTSRTLSFGSTSSLCSSQRGFLSTSGSKRLILTVISMTLPSGTRARVAGRSLAAWLR